MRIGLDLDGVLYPWHYSIHKYFVEFKGYEGDIGTFWEKDRHLITDYYVSIPLLYLDVTPTEDVLTYVPKIAELGEIYYITSRIPDLEWATRKFLDLNGMPFKENLVFAEEKATPVRHYKLDYFLDDLPKHVTSLQNLCQAYLFKAIHNRNNREGFTVINSMKEFYELLKDKVNA